MKSFRHFLGYFSLLAFASFLFAGPVSASSFERQPGYYDSGHHFQASVKAILAPAFVAVVRPEVPSLVDVAGTGPIAPEYLASYVTDAAALFATRYHQRC